MTSRHRPALGPTSHKNETSTPGSQRQQSIDVDGKKTSQCRPRSCSCSAADVEKLRAKCYSASLNHHPPRSQLWKSRLNPRCDHSDHHRWHTCPSNRSANRLPMYNTPTMLHPASPMSARTRLFLSGDKAHKRRYAKSKCFHNPSFGFQRLSNRSYFIKEDETLHHLEAVQLRALNAEERRASALARQGCRNQPRKTKKQLFLKDRSKTGTARKELSATTSGQNDRMTLSIPDNSQDTWATVKEDTWATVKEDTSATVKEDTSATVKEDTLATVKEDTLATVKEDHLSVTGFASNDCSLSGDSASPQLLRRIPGLAVMSNTPPCPLPGPPPLLKSPSSPGEAFTTPCHKSQSFHFDRPSIRREAPQLFSPLRVEDHGIPASIHYQRKEDHGIHYQRKEDHGIHYQRKEDHGIHYQRPCSNATEDISENDLHQLKEQQHYPLSVSPSAIPHSPCNRECLCDHPLPALQKIKSAEIDRTHKPARMSATTSRNQSATPSQPSSAETPPTTQFQAKVCEAFEVHSSDSEDESISPPAPDAEGTPSKKETDLLPQLITALLASGTTTESGSLKSKIGDVFLDHIQQSNLIMDDKQRSALASLFGKNRSCPK